MPTLFSALGSGLRNNSAGADDFAILSRPGRRSIFLDRAFSCGLGFHGGVLVVEDGQCSDVWSVYGLLLAYRLCYFPTIALSNSLTLQHLRDPGRDFRLIRVFGTLGWIAIGVAVGSMAIEKSATPFLSPPEPRW